MAVEGGPVAAVWIDDEHFATGCGVKLDEARQLLRMIPLVKNVASDDEVEFAQGRIAAGPVSPPRISSVAGR